MRPLDSRHRPTRCPTKKTSKTYLVTGGHGMLGSHIVEALLARGEDRVHIFDHAPSPLFEEEARQGRVTFHRGDLRDRVRISEVCRGVDTVFHTAASVNYWADLPFELGPIHAVNVTGTENVVEACVAGGVKQLLATSSTSVVVPRDIERRPLALADESAPLATAPFLCHYVQTKGLAEKAVLAADGRGGLCTAALRPGGMYGPRDRLLTAAVAMGLPGIGLRDNVIDHIYVENVVHAFLLLEQRLVPRAPVCGRAYFVTNYAPSSGSERAFDFNTAFSARFGRRFRLLPAAPVSALARAMESAAWASRGRLAPALGELGKLRPASLALSRATYYFSHRRAAEDFGYEPLYTSHEGMDLTARHWMRAP
jgi:nucleoside-diphosphate-sugar epimerase